MADKDRLIIFDTTLRDGEQSPGFSMNHDEKLRMAAMLEELAIMKKNLHGRLRIGAMPTSSPMLPIVARLFQKEYPVVQVDIQFMGIDQLTLALKNFELDVGFTDLEQLTDSRLETLALYEEPLHLLLPDNDWLDDQPTVTWAEAANLPLSHHLHTIFCDFP